MKIITRMLLREVMIATCFILFALLALFAFFDLIGQAGDIGSQYTLLQAFLLTALVLPDRCYEIIPIAAMLGAVFTLAKLAANSEFTVMRTSGLSPWKLGGMLMIPGLILVGFSYGIGEFVAPPFQHLSKEFKLDFRGKTFTGKGFSSGIWVREVQRDQGGKPERVCFVNVKSLKPGEAAYDWQIFIFDKKNNLESIVDAKRGSYSKEAGWILEEVTKKKFPSTPKEATEPTEESVQVETSPKLVWGKGLDGNIFGLMMVKPEDMSLAELHKYIDHLKANGQQTKTYETAFWTKLYYPIAILVMMVLAMPFAYLNPRSGGIAIKIFMGIMVGIGFYALNNFFSFMTFFGGFPAYITALIPSLIMLSLAIGALAWMERR